MRVWMRMALLALLVTLLSVTAAAAERAVSVGKSCRITASGASRKELGALTDGRYSTYLKVRSKGEIIADGKGKALGSVLLQFYDRPTKTEVWAKTDGGDWTFVAERGQYLSDWVELPEGTGAVKIVNTDKSRLFMAELTVYGTGDRPENSPEWVTCGKCDLMVVACHPDDELLWLGGLLPTYAGERGLQVQVIYAVPSTPIRRLELLDGLWHCGVKAYPDFFNLPDVYAKKLKAMYSRWGKNKMHRLMTGFIRRYQPDVLVSHDLNGEYGHAGHQAVADTVKVCVGYAADPEKFTASAKEYGVWQVQKCYLHLYGEGKIRLDWHRPLSAFGGKDGMTVAKEAMALHRSQVKHGWAIEEGGPCDNTLFGLVYSAVGPDEKGDDLFEHIGAEDDEPMIEEVLLSAEAE